MSTAAAPAPAPAPPAKRHPLSLPPGSVRAIHVLGIVAFTADERNDACFIGFTDPRVEVDPVRLQRVLVEAQGGTIEARILSEGGLQMLVELKR